MKRTPFVLVLALGSLAACVAISTRSGGLDSPVAVAPESAGGLPPAGPDGWVPLAQSIFSPERARWCSFVELARTPEHAGMAITLELTIASGEGMSAKTWIFRDSEGHYALSGDAATCYSTAKTNLPVGQYKWGFTLGSGAVAVDPALDAAMMADPAWKACFDQHPEPVPNDIVIPLVVDEGKQVWASDGTREVDTLRDCLGKAATAWAKPQVDGGTFPLAPPAVVFGAVEGVGVQRTGAPRSLGSTPN